MGLRPPGSTLGLGVLWGPFPVGIPGRFAPCHWEFLAGDAGPGSHLSPPVGLGFRTGRETSGPSSAGSPLAPSTSEFKNILKPELSSLVDEGAGQSPEPVLVLRAIQDWAGRVQPTPSHPCPTPMWHRSVPARRNTE